MAAIWKLVSVLFYLLEKGTSQTTFGENDVSSLNSMSFVDSCIETEVMSSVRKTRFIWTLEGLSCYFRNDRFSENHSSCWDRVAETQFSEPSGANWTFALMAASKCTQRPEKVIIRFNSDHQSQAHPSLAMKAAVIIGRGNSSAFHTARMFPAGEYWSGELDIPVSVEDWIEWRKSVTVQLELDLMTVNAEDKQGNDTVCKIPTLEMIEESLEGSSSPSGFATGSTKMLDPFSYSDE